MTRSWAVRRCFQGHTAPFRQKRVADRAWKWPLQIRMFAWQGQTCGALRRARIAMLLFPPPVPLPSAAAPRAKMKGRPLAIAPHPSDDYLPPPALIGDLPPWARLTPGWAIA